MRSRVIVECRCIMEVCYERAKGYLKRIFHWLKKSGKRSSNITEEYIIDERFAGAAFVKDFINQRTQNTMLNRYCIKIKISAMGFAGDDSNEETMEIGKAILRRKRNIIDEATLVVKKGKEDIIYWNFKK